MKMLTKTLVQLKKVRHWLPNLSLTFQDKFLIQNGNWLNDNHMRAANDIAEGQFKDINGLQDTAMVPYLDKNGTWVIPELKMIRQEPPCVQFITPEILIGWFPFSLKMTKEFTCWIVFIPNNAFQHLFDYNWHYYTVRAMKTYKC